MKNSRTKSSKHPFILAVSAAALLAGLLPARASLLLDPTGGTVLFDDAAFRDDLVNGGRSLGFTGNFFGTPTTTVDVSTNGHLNFSNDASLGGALGPGIARIAVLYDDLVIQAGSGGSVSERLLPGTFYAATWSGMQNFPSSVTTQTFQAAWFGAATTLRGFTFQPDDIVFSYLGPIQPFNGDSATVGLNDGVGGFVPAPGTTDGSLSAATANLLPAAEGGFLLFRPDGAGNYTPYIAAPVLQNSTPVGTPVDANFIVVENVTTGSESESNTIGSVLFAEGASLRVFNTLTVTRAYTQSATGILQLSLGGPGTFDKVVVGGVATLAGTLAVSYTNGFVPKRGETFEVLTAAGGVVGEFAEVTDPLATPLLGLGAIYSSNAVLVTIIQQSFEDLARTFGGSPNHLATGRALDSVAFGSTVPEFIDYLNEAPAEDFFGNLDRVAPEELASIFNIANSLANVQMTNLSRRLEDLRAGSTGFSGQRFALQGTLPDSQGGLGLAGPTGKDAKDCKSCPVVVPSENRWGFFVNGSGEFVDIESTGNAHGYDFQSGGITLGVDYRVCENFVVGLTVGYAHTGADLAGQGFLDVDAGRIGLYATAFANGFYLDAAVSGGYSGFDTRRSALDGSARGDTTGAEFDGYVGVGYDWKVGGLTVGPIANFQYTYLDLDGFTEQGSLAPLNFGSQSNESIRTTVGLKASYDWKCCGRLIRPSVRVAWQHEFGDTEAALTSSFASGGSSFTVTGPNIGEDALLVGVGASVQISERASAFLYYDGEFGRSNYQLHAISGGVRIEF